MAIIIPKTERSGMGIGVVQQETQKRNLKYMLDGNQTAMI
jgi:hypothetical protein